MTDKEIIDFIRKTWKCTRCGTEFESTVNMSWFKQGQNRTYARCTACYPDCHHTSYGEEDLKIFIESVYDGVIEYNNRCLSVDGHKYEIDINLIEKI